VGRVLILAWGGGNCKGKGGGKDCGRHGDQGLRPSSAPSTDAGLRRVKLRIALREPQGPEHGRRAECGLNPSSSRRDFRLRQGLRRDWSPWQAAGGPARQRRVNPPSAGKLRLRLRRGRGQAASARPSLRPLGYGGSPLRFDKPGGELAVHRPQGFLTPRVGGCRIAFDESDPGQPTTDAGPRFS